MFQLSYIYVTRSVGFAFLAPLACSTALDLTDSNYSVVFIILTVLAVGSVILLEWGRRAGH